MSVDLVKELRDLVGTLRRRRLYRSAVMVTETIAEVERLRAIEAKLPKTADGVAIAVGMNLAIIHNSEGPLWAGVLSVTLAEYYTDPMVVTVRTTDGEEDDLNADACYSTREAAEAAMKGGPR